MNVKCQVFTPTDYVEVLLDSAGYRNNLWGKRLLENSCGDGNILVEAVRRYIEDCFHNGIAPNDIKTGLENDIVGIEIDEKHFKKCIDNLNGILDEYGISNVKWRIYNEDFLRWNDVRGYDYIIGNPPYITYGEMEISDRVFLNAKFDSCKKGKFDYCYAFIEKSISLLSSCGHMSYIIPSSVFKTVFGSDIRRIMLPYISHIYDYTQEKVFDSALVKSAIITLDVHSKPKIICYRDSNQTKTINISKADIGDKWVFEQVKKGFHRFGDYYKVSHSVATLLNDAFVLKVYKQDAQGNYIVGKHIIERGIVHETATPKTFRTGKVERVIFPYYYNENGLVRYEEKDLRKLFPGAYNYLKSYKTQLLNRASDKSAEWYEYGRSQALANLNCEKCLISTVISSDVMIYKLSKECIPYSGMYIVPLTDNPKYNLDRVIEILGSRDFKRYVEGMGIHINGNSVRITSKDIEEYCF